MREKYIYTYQESKQGQDEGEAGKVLVSATKFTILKTLIIKINNILRQMSSQLL